MSSAFGIRVRQGQGSTGIDKRNRDKSSLDAIIHIILSNSIKNNQNHLL